MQNKNSKFSKVKTVITSLFVIAVLYPQNVFGGNFANSKLAKGTENLLKDVSLWLIGIAALVGGVFIVYFAIRRGGADEMDRKIWDKRLATAIVSTIAAVIGTSILAMIISYYQ
jgi:hypothetical protein